MHAHTPVVFHLIVIAIRHGACVSLHALLSAISTLLVHVYFLCVPFYRSLCRWLSIQVSTPSAGVGYKIAFMVYQRCKPCLCLFNAGAGGLSGLPAVIRGDRMLDVSTKCWCN